MFSSLGLKEGLGYHIYDIDNGKSIEGILYVNKLYLYIAELVYGFAVYFGKISILALYYRMFGVTNIKLPIRILIVCSTVWFIIRVSIEPCIA